MRTALGKNDTKFLERVIKEESLDLKWTIEICAKEDFIDCFKTIMKSGKLHLTADVKEIISKYASKELGTSTEKHKSSAEIIQKTWKNYSVKKPIDTTVKIDEIREASATEYSAGKKTSIAEPGIMKKTINFILSGKSGNKKKERLEAILKKPVTKDGYER